MWTFHTEKKETLFFACVEFHLYKSWHCPNHTRYVRQNYLFIYFGGMMKTALQVLGVLAALAGLFLFSRWLHSESVKPFLPDVGDFDTLSMQQGLPGEVEGGYMMGHLDGESMTFTVKTSADFDFSKEAVGSIQLRNSTGIVILPFYYGNSTLEILGQKYTLSETTTP